MKVMQSPLVVDNFKKAYKIMISFIKKIICYFWFDVLLMSILLMCLTPYGSFDIKSFGFYISILTSILTIKSTNYMLNKYQKYYIDKLKVHSKKYSKVD